MTYIILALLAGFFIPYLSRRFAKFMPATPVYAIYRSFKQNKQAKKRHLCPKYQKLLKQYLCRSFVYGIIFAIISAFVVYKFDNNICWYLSFIWMLLLLGEIDLRTFLLPDLLTVPLIIIGFTYACLAGVIISPTESAYGSLLGYILPIIASAFVAHKSFDAFGGGDIKFLAGIGAWLGITGVIYTILGSCIIFALHTLAKKQKSGAFGPSLAISAIIVLLFFS